MRRERQSYETWLETHTPLYPKGSAWNLHANDLDAPLISPSQIPKGYIQYWDAYHKEYRLAQVLNMNRGIIQEYPNNTDTMEEEVQPVEESVETPAEEVAEESTEEVVESPSEEPTEASEAMPEGAVEKAAEEPVEEPVA